MSILDDIFHMTEWLRTTPLNDLALDVSTWESVEWIQSHSIMVPAMQIIHLLAIAMGFGAVLMFNLRLLGVSGAGRTVGQLSHRFLPWMWWSLIILFVTGVGMVLGDPARLIVNPIFWMKMAAFVVMLLASIAHYSVVNGKLKVAAGWDPTRAGGGAIRASALIMILLWILIMFGGRWMAYAPM